MKTGLNRDKRDKYLTLIKDVPSTPIGLSLLDRFRMMPGRGSPSLVRTKGLSLESRYQHFNRDAKEYLCPGAAVGLDENNIVRHLQPWNKVKGFLGFVERNMDNNRVLVWTRGIVVVTIPGLHDRSEFFGVLAFMTGVNDFNLRNGYRIGKLLYIQPDRKDVGAVAFQRFDDPRPLQLSTSIQAQPSAWI
ncbi:hypothetical protein BMS3Bbin08_00059 [bacterium BMS3Bbin08]|nr:hypothetical protein BMS3Bbin08_00059 [bacterium BMS3Bbin08]